MKYVLMDIEQTLLQKCNYYHGEEGIGDYTPYIEDAKQFTLEEISAISKALPNEKFVIVPVNFGVNSVMTAKEAADLWGKDDSNLRKALRHSGKFIEGIDYRLSGKIILVTKEAMHRVYGDPKEKE